MIFLIYLIISIFIHELGHLITAKIVKCKVEVFSIGFGKELFGFNYKGTRYRIALLPLGGYNKLKDELNYSRSKYAFTNLSYRKKVLIILAGSLANIIIGLITLIIGIHYLNYNSYYFGFLNLILGITNLLPIPALDGSYPWLVWLEKFMGKKRGYALMSKICKWGFFILMILNILCIPYLLEWIYQNKI
jgi:membrane-associated protease RseP (regulator of RpoE activity)